MFPPPQISDQELDEIAMLGYTSDLMSSEELTEGNKEDHLSWVIFTFSFIPKSKHVWSANSCKSRYYWRNAP